MLPSLCAPHHSLHATARGILKPLSMGAQNIFSMLDIDEDGDISQEELRNAFVKYSALRQAIGEGPNFK